jgi:hypothetical protein
MSTALAIAGVTQVLKDLLNDGVINHNINAVTGTTVNVTALPPDRLETGTEQSQLNLYMYQATFNQGWRNEGLPAVNSRGERVNNPILALDLHYLLSAYTSGPQLHTEILLGYGMQLLFENPVLSRDAINKSLNPSDNVDLTALPAILRALATTGLADQVEQVKITPELMDPEEISKLWTAFSAKYRPTAAYKATVVLIQSTKPTKIALPVQERKIYVSPFQEPIIDDILSIPGINEPVLANQLIFAGSTLLINGTQLRNDGTFVNISGTDVIPADLNITDSVIKVAMPPGLAAGLQSVQVIQPALMGSPPVPHKGVASTVQAFILSPLISGDGQPNLNQVNNLFQGTIKLQVKPAIQNKQDVRLLLNEISPGTTGAFVFYMKNDIPPNPPPGPDISIPVNGLTAGTYLMRIQVDGAESPLLTDPATGKYNGPKVIIA